MSAALREGHNMIAYKLQCRDDLTVFDLMVFLKPSNFAIKNNFRVYYLKDTRVKT